MRTRPNDRRAALAFITVGASTPRVPRRPAMPDAYAAITAFDAAEPAQRAMLGDPSG
jgi:hypothetical protein